MVPIVHRNTSSPVSAFCMIVPNFRQVIFFLKVIQVILANSLGVFCSFVSNLNEFAFLFVIYV